MVSVVVAERLYRVFKIANDDMNRSIRNRQTKPIRVWSELATISFALR